MNGVASALLRLHATDDGTIAIAVTSPDEGVALSVDDAVLVLTVWSESDDVVRGRFVDQGSGAVAYFQSSDASFRRFANSIHLAVSS